MVVAAVDFAVPTHYSIGDRFPTWGEAVEVARGTIRTTVYKGQTVNPCTPYYHPKRYRQGATGLECDTRAFVQMREVQPVQDRPDSSVRSGSDAVVRSWEVFADGTTELRS